MKTSAASLFIAIAGFLQESTCMLHIGETVGTVVVTLGNQDFTGTLLKVWEDIPRWLVSEPRQPFQSYRVHFRGCDLGRSEAILRGAPTTPGHQLNRVHVKIGNIELESYDHLWERYVYGNYMNLFQDCLAINRPDQVYITIPNTKKVFYIRLETPSAHQVRQQQEDLERQVG